MGKKLVYTAGPYRDARGTVYVENNIRAAEAVAKQLWQWGLAVICPHTNTRHLDGLIPSEEFIAGDLVMVERCDGVVMLPGWENSVGSQAELQHATAKGVATFSWESERDRALLRSWADQVPARETG